MCSPNSSLSLTLADCRDTRRCDFASGVMENPFIDVQWVDEPLHRGALLFLEARADKGYSLCDAVSFLRMREQGIQEALTTDRHFEQEGLLKA